MNFLFILRIIWGIALALVLWKACVPDPGDMFHIMNDKLAHFLIFLFLGILGLVAWHGAAAQYQVISFLAIYGAAIEVIQFFVDKRSMSLGDWIMDLLGLISALLVIKLVLQYRENLATSD